MMMSARSLWARFGARGASGADSTSATSADSMQGDDASMPAAPSAPNFAPADPREAASLALVLERLDGSLGSVERAWSTGGLISKVERSRVVEVLDTLAARDAEAVANLLIEIAAPDNAVSSLAVATQTNNVRRESGARGIMKALATALVEIERLHGLHEDKGLSATALLARLRGWVADPFWCQPPAAGAGAQQIEALDQANQNLLMMGRLMMGVPEVDVPGKGSFRVQGGQVAPADGPQLRLGIVAPLAVALQLCAVMQKTPRSVVDLAVAGFERAKAEPIADDASEEADGTEARESAEAPTAHTVSQPSAAL